jgi:cysteine synthase
MTTLGLEAEIVDPAVRAASVRRFRERGIVLPTFEQLAHPERIPESIRASLANVAPDAPDPHNLFRVHWYNGLDRKRFASLPAHIVLPESFTGVKARIVVALGRLFPMIEAHKVLAAYGCLAPRVITGQFDPEAHRAVWPSTGNYCRGGVAISRIMACRSVAVLPEGMSTERFHWLERWVSDPSDIIRTPGSESNVKEIYDECARLDRDPENVIFNQFCEFGNHLAHYLCTGSALGAIFEAMREREPDLELRGFTSATGSAGTIGAGDWLKDEYGASIVAVEALECPTLLYNGFGAHNIQGIGDKHVPLIHNVTNTDFVMGVSDHATDALLATLGTEAGHAHLLRRGVPADVACHISDLGPSGLCNVLAAIKLAKYMDLGPDDVVMTVATDGGAMYRSEVERVSARDYPGGIDAVEVAQAYGQHVLGAGTDHTLEMTRIDRDRVFNLGYFTWVEQQGVTLEAFEARRQQRFWQDLRLLLDEWDELIRAFNKDTGLVP